MFVDIFDVVDIPGAFIVTMAFQIVAMAMIFSREIFMRRKSQGRLDAAFDESFSPEEICGQQQNAPDEK